MQDKSFPAFGGGCKPKAAVQVTSHGGRGGDPAYAGGYINGFTGHAASLLSAEDMVALGEALIAAASEIKASGLPSFEDLRSRKRQTA